jgi:hypothetical protein
MAPHGQTRGPTDKITEREKLFSDKGEVFLTDEVNEEFPVPFRAEER